MKKTNPFDFVKSVSNTKKDIMVDDIEEKQYTPFLTNKALSYHQDAVYFANEMNILHQNCVFSKRLFSHSHLILSQKSFHITDSGP